MKTLLYIFAFTLLTFISCDNSQANSNRKQETPKALEDKSASFESGYKRGYDDLVERLYKEVVDKTPELKELESKIDNLNENQGDSAESFSTFNEKSRAYYNAVDRHVNSMKDSLLKVKMRNVIASSLTKYNSSISLHNTILNSIEEKRTTIADLHTILKITKTLPLIEQYQSDNLPSTKSLESFSKQQDQIIKLADRLTKK